MHTEEKTINRMLGLDQLNQNAPMYKRWTKYCLQWYIRKANRNRIGYYFLSIITVFRCCTQHLLIWMRDIYRNL